MDIFCLISPSDILSIDELTTILKIIGQFDVKYIRTLLITIITSVFNVSRYVINSDNVCLDFQNSHYYPLANEVAKGYSNATVRPSVRP